MDIATDPPILSHLLSADLAFFTIFLLFFKTSIGCFAMLFPPSELGVYKVLWDKGSISKLIYFFFGARNIVHQISLVYIMSAITTFIRFLRHFVAFVHLLPVALILLCALILSVAPCALRCASPPDPVKFSHIWRFSDNLLFSENLFSPCFSSFCIPKVPKAGAGSPCGKKWAIASVSVGAVVPALLSFRCCLALSACAIVPTLLCYCAFRFRLVYLCLANRLSRSKQLCAFAQTAVRFRP